jgi:hypothetical protein
MVLTREKPQVQVFNVDVHVCGDCLNREFLCGESYHYYNVGIFK